VKDIQIIVHGNARQAYSAAVISAMREDANASVKVGSNCYEVIIGTELRQVHQYINDHE
jgi:hypothetical protein